MQALLQGLGRLLMRSFTTQAKPPEQKDYVSTRHATLMKIFQLLNDKIYDIQENVPLNDPLLRRMVESVKGIKSPLYDHLQDAGRMRVTSMASHMCDNGPNITYVEYSDTKTEVGNIERASLVLSTIQNPNGEIQFIPQFSMTGRYVFGQDGTKLFKPEHIRCLTYKNGQYGYYPPSNDAGVKASILYANDAFLQILAGEKIDVIGNQRWFFDASKHPNYQTRNDIANRTAHTLEQELAARPAGQPTERQPQ